MPYMETTTTTPDTDGSLWPNVDAAAFRAVGEYEKGLFYAGNTYNRYAVIVTSEVAR